MSRQLIFDTETTGLNPKDGHRVIEIGCVELINRKFTGNNFHYYLNPHRIVDQDSIKIHGLTNEFLAKKPSFCHIVDEFLDYIRGAELIAHNAKFDLSFLNNELELVAGNLGKKIKLNDIATITDTLELAKKLHPGQRNSLDALCKRYSVDNTGRELHGALLDSELLAEVYLAMTGGQVSLEFFNESEKNINSNANNKNNKQHNNYKKFNLSIVKADQQELTEHNQFLKLLDSKDDECLWRKMES